MIIIISRSPERVLLIELILKKEYIWQQHYIISLSIKEKDIFWKMYIDVNIKYRRLSIREIYFHFFLSNFFNKIFE